MVSTDNIKIIIKLCPNYSSIIDYECKKEDYFTKDLIKFYLNYLSTADLSNKLEQDRAIGFDKSLGEYISNPKFARKVQEHFTFEESEDMIGDMGVLGEDYKEEELSQTKWL